MDPMLLLLTLLLLLLKGARSSESGSVAALLEFRNGVSSDPGGLIRSTWDANRVDQSGCPLQWHGVTCSGGNVTAVVLAGLSLAGLIRAETLGTLTSLSTLDLSNNSFQGRVPPDFANLLALSYLDLSNNMLTGGFPDTLAALKNLRNLSLAGNELGGRVPDGVFSAMSQLLQLDLARNRLSGPLPSTLTSLQQLFSLDLSANDLSGVAPRGLSSLRALRRLDLHRNQLSGSVDPSLMSLQNLEYIDLSDNQLTGSLPWQQGSIMTFPQPISYVNLSRNQFSGELAPENVGGLPIYKLETLDVSSNLLSGKLPSFGFAFAIKFLRLQNNSFTGVVPEGLFSEDSGLQELDMSFNQLTGSLPTIKAISLISVKLGSNRLTGPLPIRLGSVAEVDLSNNGFSGNMSVMGSWGDGLQTLDLSGNSLSGALPNQTEHLIRLIHLNVSHNNLSGSIPSLYASFGKLTTLDLSFNALDGEIPGDYFHSSSLSTLSFSNNRLTGGIPILSFLSPSVLPGQLLSPTSTEVSSAPSTILFSPLQVLDLSSNRLNGSIPLEIASLTALQSINLSRNNLSGVIPSQLSNLTYLEDLDLSFNRFTGHIPDHLPSSLRTLNLSNNYLTGVIPADLARFPRSSFFPGNVGLRSPAGNPSGSGGIPGLFSGRRKAGLSSSVKAGLIGGCVAATALIVAAGMLIYLRRKGCRFEEVEKGFDQRDIPKSQHKEFAPLPPARAGSVSISREQLLPAAEIGPSEQSPQEAEIERSSPSGRVPTTFQHSASLKSRSPDKLAGDLSLLNTSIVFTPDELSSAPAEVLGRSSHGTSYKATLDSGHVLTVKWLREGLARDKKAFNREAKKFGSIQHPNIVPLRGYYWGPREHEKLVISDYLPSGSLADRLSGRSPALDWPQRLSIASDISLGLWYLHTKHRLPHGNLKATNVLLDEGLVGRLSDYCIHRLMTEAGTANQIVNAGALGYRAPELANSGRPKPTLKADVYAFGVILLEILTGKGAGDIISGNSGAVDLTDWVKVVVSQGRGRDCYDQTLAGMVSEEQEQQMEQLLGLALRCISPQKSDRPGVKVVHEETSALLRR